MCQKRVENIKAAIVKLQSRREYPFANLDIGKYRNSVHEEQQDSTLPRIGNFARTVDTAVVSGLHKTCLDSVWMAYETIKLERLPLFRVLYLISTGEIDEKNDVRLTMNLFLTFATSYPSSQILSHAYAGSFPFQTYTSACPSCTPIIIDYILRLKIDLVHAGISTQLCEGAATIEAWLPRMVQTLKNPESAVEMETRQLQRLIATLREIRPYTCDGD